jgi:hypothetical protein
MAVDTHTTGFSQSSMLFTICRALRGSSWLPGLTTSPAGESFMPLTSPPMLKVSPAAVSRIANTSGSSPRSTKIVRNSLWN